jgi:hypothetical protein
VIWNVFVNWLDKYGSRNNLLTLYWLMVEIAKHLTEPGAWTPKELARAVLWRSTSHVILNPKLTKPKRKRGSCKRTKKTA